MSFYINNDDSDEYSDSKSTLDADAELGSDDDYVPAGRSVKRRANANGKCKGRASPRKKQKKDIVLPVVAKVTILATDALDMAKATEGELARERLEKADKAIVERIKKALALASHEGTGEAEARAALRMATKFMQMHNISQADILAAESDAQKLKRAGQSIVTITSNPDLPPKSVLFSSWSARLSHAVTKFFDCKAYSTTWDDKSRIIWTFYGLAEQTVAAATAFEMCHNLILTWSAQSTQAKGRNGKNNYCHGVADGLVSMAHSERKEEARKAIKAEAERLASAKLGEEKTRQAELDRLRGLEAPNSDDDRDAKVKPEPQDTESTARAEDMQDNKRGVKVEEIPDEDEHRRDFYAAPLPEFAPRPFDYDRFHPANDGGIGSDDDFDNDYGRDFGYGHQHEPDADFVEGDNVDDLLDLDSAEPKVKIKPEPTDNGCPALQSPVASTNEVEVESVPVKPEPVDPEQTWQSEGQLIQFRNDADRIADQFLESQENVGGKPLKLKRRPVAGRNIMDAAGRKAYNTGKEDAKNIDVKRRRIKSANDHD